MALAVTTPIFAATGPGKIDSAAPPLVPAAVAPPAAPAAIAPPATPAIRSTVEEKTIDAQIADKLRAVITSGQFDKRIDRAPEREAMVAFYAARNYAPLWIADGRPDARAKAVIVQLGNAAADGLNSADYLVPAFGAASGAEALADADLTLSYSALTYARHLATGRIAPTRVLAEVDYGDHTPAPADILRKLADAADAAPRSKALIRRPRFPGAEGEGRSVARCRDAARTDRSAGGKTCQRQTCREADYRLDAGRGRPRARQYGALALAAARPRLHLCDGQHTRLHAQGRARHQEEWHTKIVAGKPQTPTPLLSAQMDNVLVNPSWHVPQSIIKNSICRATAATPTSSPAWASR